MIRPISIHRRFFVVKVYDISHHLLSSYTPCSLANLSKVARMICEGVLPVASDTRSTRAFSSGVTRQKMRCVLLSMCARYHRPGGGARRNAPCVCAHMSLGMRRTTGDHNDHK